MAATTFVPKYKKIKRNLLAEIKSGKLNPGDKLPVREKLVIKYSSTRATVDKALNELVKDNILTASRRNGTFVSDSYIQLRRIAIVSYEDSILRHASKFGDRYNYFSMFGTLMAHLQDGNYEIVDGDKVRTNPEILKDYDLILLNAFEVKELDKISNIVGREKIVLLNRYYEGYNFISTDHYGAAKELTELFLSSLSDECAIYFVDSDYDFVVDERRRGFVDACAKYNKFYRFLEFKVNKWEWNIDSFQQLKMPVNAPLVIISPTAKATGMIMRYATEQGYKFNRNFFYADFDNQDSLTNTGYLIPSVLQNFIEIANVVVKNINDNSEFSELFVPYEIINNPFLNNP